MKLWIPFGLWKGWWNLNWSYGSERLMLDLLYTHNTTHSVHTQYVGVYCVLKRSLLKSIVFYRRAPNHPINEGGEYDIQPPNDESLMFSDWSRSSVWLALLCFTVAVDFFFSFLFFHSAVWFGLQRTAGKSQWRCRPKQPGLKWLCECSVRDSFRACGKPAHSLLTVAMRERVRERKVKGREMIWTDRKWLESGRLKVRADIKSLFAVSY